MTKIEEYTVEPTTNEFWTSLFQRAQHAIVPYYLVAETVLSNQVGDSEWYDGITFRKSVVEKDPYRKDPLTQRSIVKVHFYVMKCFEVDLTSKGDMKKMLPFDRALASMFKVPSSFFKDVFAAEGINFFSAENPDNSGLVRKCQLITAMRFKGSEELGDVSECLRWLLSAETNFLEAREALSKMKDELQVPACS